MPPLWKTILNSTMYTAMRNMNVYLGLMGNGIDGQRDSVNSWGPRATDSRSQPVAKAEMARWHGTQETHFISPMRLSRITTVLGVSYAKRTSVSMPHNWRPHILEPLSAYSCN